MNINLYIYKNIKINVYIEENKKCVNRKKQFVSCLLYM